MGDYDGTFSEGRAINAVGLLGAGGMVRQVSQVVSICGVMGQWEYAGTVA